MKTPILYLLFALSFIFIISCSENSFLSDQFESESTEAQVIALTTQTVFTIENTNGNILISTSILRKILIVLSSKELKAR